MCIWVELSQVQSSNQSIIKANNKINLPMNDIEKKQKRVLNHYKMNKAQLFPQSILIFHDFTEELKQLIIGLRSTEAKVTVQQFIDRLMELVNATVQQMSIGCIVKKIAILHSLMHKLRHKQLIESLNKSAYSHLTTIITKNLQEVTSKSAVKRQSSLSKVQGLIRKLSGSKQRSPSKNGRMNIQNQNEKGALIEIINKIVKPFCLYLLKIVEDFEVYGLIESSKKEYEGVVIWKLINWSKALGSIVMEVHRLGRYFKDDMLSLSVYMNYLISTDIAMIQDYYDAIKRQVDKQAQKWRQSIRRAQRDFTDSCQLNEADVEQQLLKVNELGRNKELLQLKELISETRAIKEKLNYIYGNSMLISWNQYFTRPVRFSFNNKATKEEGNIEFILEFFQKHNRPKSKKVDSNQNYYGKFESISLCNTLQTLAKDSPCKQKKQQKKPSSLQKQISSSSQIFFDELNDDSLLTKIQKVKMSKTRLNKCINPSAQKLKFINELTHLKMEQANKIDYKIAAKVNLFGNK